MTDAIGARLEQLLDLSDQLGGHGLLVDTYHALRTVVSLCELVREDGGDFVSIEVLLEDIACALGVEDD